MFLSWHRNAYVMITHECIQLPDLKRWGKENSLARDMIKHGLFTDLLIFTKYALKTAYEQGISPNTGMLNKSDKVPVLMKLR